MFNRRKWDLEADFVAVGSGLGGLGCSSKKGKKAHSCLHV